MPADDIWRLPEGVTELLPPHAFQLEALRRRVLELFAAGGYEQVAPPLLERSPSLLVGAGEDLSELTFRTGDGSLAVRADITPQTARIDAHSRLCDGVQRLCYAGPVLHTRPRHPLAARELHQLGAEIYGSEAVEADAELVALMLELLALAGIAEPHLDLGHAGIYRALAAAAGLTADAERCLFDAVGRKDSDALRAVLAEGVAPDLAKMLSLLPSLRGRGDVLARAERALAGSPPAALAALAELRALSERLESAGVVVDPYIDLAELRGYRYHNGLLFAAYVDGCAQAVAQGGRCDGIGGAYGRSRPATGFSADLTCLLSLCSDLPMPPTAIFAPPPVGDQLAWRRELHRLRAAGECVVVALPGESPPPFCDRLLAAPEADGGAGWLVVSLQP